MLSNTKKRDHPSLKFGKLFQIWHKCLYNIPPKKQFSRKKRKLTVLATAVNCAAKKDSKILSSCFRGLLLLGPELEILLAKGTNGEELGRMIEMRPVNIYWVSLSILIASIQLFLTVYSPCICPVKFYVSEALDIYPFPWRLFHGLAFPLLRNAFWCTAEMVKMTGWGSSLCPPLTKWKWQHPYLRLTCSKQMHQLPAVSPWLISLSSFHP